MVWAAEDSMFADTGASFDLVKSDQLLGPETRDLRPALNPMEARTASGDMLAMAPALDERIRPFVTAGSPNLLSAGLRCEH